MAQPVETADPDQYLRLLLIRLLETQKCLSPLLKSPAFAPVRMQFQVNAHTLSEIESWLASPAAISHPGTSPSSVPAVDAFGQRSKPTDPPPSITAGTLENPFVWNAAKTPRRSESEVRSSLPSNVKLSDSASISNGRVIFRLPSSPTKPNATSHGPHYTSDPKGNGDRSRDRPQ